MKTFLIWTPIISIIIIYFIVLICGHTADKKQISKDATENHFMCLNCENAAKSALATGKVSYYRWKNAKILMIGCETHLKEIYMVLRHAQTVLAKLEAEKSSIILPKNRRF